MYRRTNIVRYVLLFVVLLTALIVVDRYSEWRTQSGLLTRESAERIVRESYLRALRREPDPMGLENYVQLLLSKQIHKAELLNILKSSEERKELIRKERIALKSLSLVLGVWVCCIATSVLVGRAAIRSLSRVLNISSRGWRLFDEFCIGLSLLAAIWWTYAFFLPIRWPGVPLGLGIMVMVAAAALTRMTQGGAGLSRKGTWQWVGGIVFAVCAALICATKTTVPRFQAYDTLLYHASAIRWMREYPAIHGLANLHIQLGKNSVYFLLAGVIESFRLEGKSSWILPGFFPWITTVQLFAYLTMRNLRKLPWATFFASGMWTFALERAYAQSPGLYYDDAAQLFLAISAVDTICFLELWFRKKGPPGLIRALRPVLSATVSFLIKPIAAMGLLLAALGVVCTWAMRRRQKRVSVSCAAPIAVSTMLPLTIWGARNAVLAGWLLFPAAVFPLPVDWKVPSETSSPHYCYEVQTMAGLRKTIRDWARTPGINSEAVPWLRLWWSRHRPFREFRCFLPLGILAALLISAWALLRKEKILWLTFGVSLAYVILQLIFWFTNAPDLRFGQVFLWMFGAAPLAFLLAYCLPSVFREVLLYVLVILVLTIWPGDFRRGCLEAVRHWRDAKIRRVPALPVRPWVVPNGQEPPLIVFIPTKGDQVGDADLPNTPYPRANLYARKPGNLRAGFRSGPMPP